MGWQNATHSFMRVKLIWKLGLARRVERASLAYWYAVWKGWAAWNKWGGVACDLIMWDIGIWLRLHIMWNRRGELIFEDTFFETHMVDVRHEPVCLWCAMKAKNWVWNWQKTPMVGLAKWNLVSMDQMKNEQIVVVARLEWLQLTHGEARKDGPPLNHICGMLVRYKDILTNRLFKRINDHQGVENNFAQ